MEYLWRQLYTKQYNNNIHISNDNKCQCVVFKLLELYDHSYHNNYVTMRSVCNMESTGSSLVSYCVGTLSKFFAHNCSAIPLHLHGQGLQVHF